MFGFELTWSASRGLEAARMLRCLLEFPPAGCHTVRVPSNASAPEGENVAVSVLFRIDRNGDIEVEGNGPVPAVVVDADGLHAESGTITHVGEDLGGDL